MSLETLLKEAKRLNPQERLELVTAIWDSYKHDSSFNELTEEQLTELRKRKKAYLKNPQNVLTWEEVKLQVIGS